MSQVEPKTKITEPIPAIVRPGRPPKKISSSLVPPMPPDLPKGQWSEQSLKVLKERYLLKNESGETLETPDGMCWRVAWDIACAESNFGKSYQDIESQAREYYSILHTHEFLPNSPTLMNAGKNNGLQYSGCYVIPVEDSIEGIFDGIKYAAIIHKSAGGTGFSFSRLRPANARVGSTRGVASGPVSFMKVYDAATEQIKQGGARRGANMGILRVDHPDVLEFIHCKENGGITNFNISVAITDKFMEAYKEGKSYDLIDPRTKQVAGQLDAVKVMEEITNGAWKTGDPGLIFIDKINAGTGNPIPKLGPVESTNPCVTGDTRVYTELGLVRISDLVGVKNIRILTKNSWQTIQDVILTGTKRVYLLKTREGYQIKLTEDHKILTERGWVPACDLNKSDRIYINSQKGGFGKEGSLELGKVLGWLVGDGTMKATEAVLMFFGAEKKQLAPVFAQIVNTLTDGMQVMHRAYPVGVCWVDERDEARVKSVRLWRLAQSYGITHDHKLLVPERVFLGTEEMQRGFLQALFTADGHVAGTSQKGVSVRLTSIDLSLLIDVQKLLLNFGIASKIYQFRRKEQKRLLPDGHGGTKEYLCKAYHDLVISKDNLYRFASEIGFLVDYKNAKLEALTSSYKDGTYSEPFVAQFLALESLGAEEVYDLTEPMTHSFIANGLVVHNCGEQPLYPFDVCNLGSIFLTYFVEDKKINWEKLEKVTKTAVRFLDSVIERNPYPLPQVKEMSQQVRRIGLGVGGWADMLVQLEIPYDSQEALDLAEKIMGFIKDKSHEASQDLAEERGGFPLFEDSIYKSGKPLRNATVTTIAPTGSIGVLAGCSTGIEPLFAIAYLHNNNLGRQLAFFDPGFEKYAAGKDWYTPEVKEKISKEGTLAHIAEVPDEAKRIFATAHDISYEWHVKMQAAFQKYTDNAVSKTINFPNSATTEDIKKAYLLAYEAGCMGITVYRDGCKDIQVLNLGTNGHAKKELVTMELQPRPVKVEGATYRIETPLGRAFITVNHNANHEPFEVFVGIGKAGSEVAAMSEAIGRLISANFRFGNHSSPRERALEIVDQLQGIGGGNAVGFGANRVRSLPDAVAKAIAMHFNLNEDLKVEKIAEQLPLNAKRDLCPTCGAAAFVFEEGCSKCYACGYSKC